MFVWGLPMRKTKGETMLPFLSNVFYDTSSPWYYIIGVLFLLLIFGAVAVYVIWNNKKNKTNADQAEQENKEGEAETAETDEAQAETDKSETSSEQQPESDK